MGELWVTYQGGDHFVADVRGHRIDVDQPLSDGGEDTAPTPVELFAASLATCVAHYARRYLARHDLPTEGLTVRADFDMADDRPARVKRVHVDLQLPDGVPFERRAALLAVAAHCTVHNTLENPPEVVVAVDGRAAAA